MMPKKLSRELQEEARQWRIDKCGYDSFEALFECFKQEVINGREGLKPG